MFPSGRCFGLACCVLAAALSPRNASGSVTPLNSLPLWPTVQSITAALPTASMTERANAERRLISLGKNAIGPLLGICTREMAQCPEVLTILPRFGADLIDVVLERGVESDSTFVVGCRVVAGMGGTVANEVKALAISDRGAIGRRLAMCVLRTMGPEGIPTLLQLSDEGNLNVRAAALEELVEARDPRAADAFLRAFRDGSLRQVSVRGSASLKDVRAIPNFLELLNDRSHFLLGEAALWGLGSVYSGDLRPVIARTAWTRSEVMIRRAASDVLNSTRDPIANRLGRRFYVRNRRNFLLYYMWGGRAAVGVLAFCVAILLAARSGRLWGIGLAILIGIYWGYFAVDQWIFTEAMLLFVFLPLTLATALLTGASPRFVKVVFTWVASHLAFFMPAAGSMLFVGPISYLGAAFGPHVFAFLGMLYLWKRREEAAARLSQRQAILTTAGAFYLSYAVSFAALWGYLGF